MIYGLIIGLVAGAVIVWVIMSSGIGGSSTFIGKQKESPTTTPVISLDVPWDKSGNWTGIEWSGKYIDSGLELYLDEISVNENGDIQAVFNVIDEKGNVLATAAASKGSVLKELLLDSDGERIMVSDLVVDKVIARVDKKGDILQNQSLVLYEDPFDLIDEPTLSTDVSSITNGALIYAANNQNGGPGK